MADILTVCLATEEADLKAFLIGQGQTHVATYSPFGENVMTFSEWLVPNVKLIGGINRPGNKVLVHTRA